jgi:citronellol/citronellal dehydrogenase
MIPGVEIPRCRKPEILADAAHAILTTRSREMTGSFVIDEDILRERGVTDFAAYAVDPGQTPLLDLFLDEALPT